MKSWQKIALAFLILTVAVVGFTYFRSAKAGNVSILTNTVDVPPSTGPRIQARSGKGAF